MLITKYEIAFPYLHNNDKFFFFTELWEYKSWEKKIDKAFKIYALTSVTDIFAVIGWLLIGGARGQHTNSVNDVFGNIYSIIGGGGNESSEIVECRRNDGISGLQRRSSASDRFPNLSFGKTSFACK